MNDATSIRSCTPYRYDGFNVSLVDTVDGPESMFSNFSEAEANEIMTRISVNLMPPYNLSNVSQLFADIFEDDVEFSWQNYGKTV